MKAPPSACWLCGHSLGSDAMCLMCDAYRKDVAPRPYDSALDPDHPRAVATVPPLTPTEKP